MKRIWVDSFTGVTLKRLARPSHPDTAVVCVTSPKTQQHERAWARIGVCKITCSYRGEDFKPSFARSVAALISDVHSPMDYQPVHARWDVVY